LLLAAAQLFLAQLLIRLCQNYLAVRDASIHD